MALKLYNIFSKQWNSIIPNGNKISIYCCGPTIYDDIHIGNGRPIIIFDALVGFLSSYYQCPIKYVRNITDIDQKIIDKVVHNNMEYTEFINNQLKNFHQLMDKIETFPPQEIKVTDCVHDIILYIKKLIENKYAYVTDLGNVYFHTSKFPHYKCLGGHTDDKPAMTVGNEQDKLYWEDFALWKRIYDYDHIKNFDGHYQINDKIFWNSPWGNGIPGWHMECSTIIEKFLGKSIDIHGGGEDLMFPHHDNEIAQSWGLHQQIFCNHWIHNGMVLINGKKMSKSTGNFIHLKNIIHDDLSSNIFRYLILSTHYRQPLNFSSNKWDDAANNVNKIFAWIQRYKNLWNMEKYNNFLKGNNGNLWEPILNDFNTVAILKTIHDIIKNFKKIIVMDLPWEHQLYYFQVIYIMKSLGFKLDLLFR